MIECEQCENIPARLTDSGLLCEDCIAETETLDDIEDTETHIEDFSGTMPLDLQEKIMRGETL